MAPLLFLGRKKVASFSRASILRLGTCHPDLQELFYRVVESFDCRVIHGRRGKDEQNEAFRNGFSRLEYPHSKHNPSPSQAVDVVPYPVDWHDTERLYYFGGFVVATSVEMEIPIVWGGDWNMNTEVDDQNFMDLAHFELVNPAD